MSKLLKIESPSIFNIKQLTFEPAKDCPQCEMQTLWRRWGYHAVPQYYCCMCDEWFMDETWFPPLDPLSSVGARMRRNG